MIYKKTADDDYFKIMKFIDDYDLHIPEDILIDKKLLIMALSENYDDYSDYINFLGVTRVRENLKYDLNTIVYCKNSLKILFQMGEDEDKFYKIIATSDKGFTVGKILYEFTKYVHDNIKRFHIYDMFDGLVYIQHIIWNKQFKGYEIIFE